MKITNFKSRAAAYAPPRGWEWDFSAEEIVRIPEDRSGFRPEADQIGPEEMERFFAALESAADTAIDPDQFSSTWTRDQNNSAAAQDKGHPLKGTGLA
jgi:hypothetical protein